MVIGYSGGKECCSNVSSRLWGGALRDDTKNGCEGDYLLTSYNSIFLGYEKISEVWPLLGPLQKVCLVG